VAAIIRRLGGIVAQRGRDLSEAVTPRYVLPSHRHRLFACVELVDPTKARGRRRDNLEPVDALGARSPSELGSA
jgi:hypothetical protein